MFQCVAEDCSALNRPFSHFCRSCGETQQPATGVTALNRWEEVQRFGFDWEFKSAAVVENAAGVASHALPASRHVVLQLETIKGFRSPKVLIEWIFIDGLLAIHQGGGFLALANPFGDLAQSPHGSSIVWTLSEDSLLRKYDSELPYAGDGQAEVFRPFAPVATADRKYVVFSTSYAVFSVELGSLSGWHYRSENKVTVLWTADLALETRLAAAPVLLTSQITRSGRRSRTDTEPDPNRIGLLLYNAISHQYSWRVVPLDAEVRESGSREVPELTATPTDIWLPIEGNPVQILSFRDQCLVFATPTGHWLWSCEAARANNDSTILYLPASDRANGDIAVDAEIADRHVFSWRNQHLLRRHEHDGIPQRDEVTRQYFELWYARSHNGRYSVERRSVWPGDPEGTQKALPQPVINDLTARPLGECLSATDYQSREMLFAVDLMGELYRRPITGDDPRPLGNIQMGRLHEIYGFRLHDPLLVVVRKDPSNDKLHKVELRSLRHPDKRAAVGGLSLKADPLPWCNFLFTCEQTSDGVAVVRREYSIEQTGNNHEKELRFLESAGIADSSA